MTDGHELSLAAESGRLAGLPTGFDPWDEVLRERVPGFVKKNRLS